MRTPHRRRGALRPRLRRPRRPAARATMAAFTRYLFSDTITRRPGRNGTNHAIVPAAVADLLRCSRRRRPTLLRAMAPAMTAAHGHSGPARPALSTRSRGYDPRPRVHARARRLARRPATGDASRLSPSWRSSTAMADHQPPGPERPTAARWPPRLPARLRAHPTGFTDDMNVNRSIQIVRRAGLTPVTRPSLAVTVARRGISRARVCARGRLLLATAARPRSTRQRIVVSADDAAVWSTTRRSHRGGQRRSSTPRSSLINSRTRAPRGHVAGGPTVTLAPGRGSAAPLPIPTLAFTHGFGLAQLPASPRRCTRPTRPSPPTTSRPPRRSTARSSRSTGRRCSSAACGGAAWHHPWCPSARASGCSRVVRVAPRVLRVPGDGALHAGGPRLDSLASSRRRSSRRQGRSGCNQSAPDGLSVGASFNLPMWVSAGARRAEGGLRRRRTSEERARAGRRRAGGLHLPADRAPRRRCAHLTPRRVAGVWEGWASATRSASRLGIRITDVRGIGTYDVGAVQIDRRFRRRRSVRVGAEQAVPLGTNTLTVRGASPTDERDAGGVHQRCSPSTRTSPPCRSARRSRARGCRSTRCSRTHVLGAGDDDPCAYDPRRRSAARGLYRRRPSARAPTRRATR